MEPPPRSANSSSSDSASGLDRQCAARRPVSHYHQSRALAAPAEREPVVGGREPERQISPLLAAVAPLADVPLAFGILVQREQGALGGLVAVRVTLGVADLVQRAAAVEEHAPAADDAHHRQPLLVAAAEVAVLLDHGTHVGAVDHGQRQRHQAAPGRAFLPRRCSVFVFLVIMRRRACRPAAAWWTAVYEEDEDRERLRGPPTHPLPEKTARYRPHPPWPSPTTALANTASFG